ncbi:MULTISPECIES: NrfD/PsrC family molybdoenzyme membrane anchor subunit [unclassified Mesobacillus]|uniref:NrfD/PsrC family molybdoenzyme membrane anchor subunit n=1 Tax=unclassified Mesobacillus TaxID=2675270 RepID=UPI00203C5671|nr:MULTISPECIES: NrfD/PsrC family molybdoenzyme membrane anchor subunit [unclassified Mesobacillus]MCM3123222.1 polysulfide reductase NrfD [Mesobacillus sp. MER 33]MCM3233295.1 polysulfide reductase NrfD [Mesobacillus sp. MER 48]
MVWGTIIAAYLFLAGLSAGAFLTSSYAARKYPAAVAVRFAGRLISPILMGIGLLLLIVDAEAGLKDPLRFIYLFTNFNSVMTIGTYFISFFMMAAAYMAVMELLKKETNKIIEYVGMVFAVATAIYTGFLIGVIGAVPLWNTAILPILFVVSAFSTGIAGTMLAASIMDKKVIHHVMSIKKIHLSLLIAEVFLIFTMFLITSSTNESAAQSVSMLLTGEYSTIFWVGLIAIGLIVPIIIEGLELFNFKKLNTSRAGLEVAAGGTSGIAATLITESAVLTGGFILRYLLLAAAVPVIFL